MGWLFGDSSSFNISKSSSCFYNELSGKCGGCIYMNPKNFTSGVFSGYTYKCVRKGGYYPWNDRPCYSVEYVDPEKVDCCERYKDFTGRKYFILTAICEILGISEDNRLYQEIKSLIDLVRTDESKVKEAVGYDSFGQELADKLRRDDSRVEICNFLLENYLVKIYSLIGLNQPDEAIKVYRSMVEYLFIRYRDKDNYSEIIDSNKLNKSKILIKEI